MPSAEHNTKKDIKTGVKGVIFDFDGTLVTLSIDFKKIKEKILREADRCGLKKLKSNLPILELLERIKKLDGGKGREFYEIGHRILREEEIRASKHTDIPKDTMDLLSTLREKEIKIGIITRNCRAVVESVINRFGIPYDVLLARDDVRKVKPDISHIEECLKLLGLKKNEVILVGDHLFDVRAGRDSGILSVGLKNSAIPAKDFIREGACFVIENLSEMKYIIGAKGFPAGKLPNMLLRYLLKKYTITDKGVIAKPGVGIDCAIFKVKDKVVLAKTDPIILTSEDIGFYLVNINVNDIAMMRGVPSHFLAVLLFPEDTVFPDIERVFSHISKECGKFNIRWVGGHTEIVSGITRPIAVGLMLGEPIKKMKRKKIREGDSVFLVKEIGIEGASIIAREKYEELKKFFSERYINRVKDAVLYPGISVFNEARILWENFDIKYMHDPTEGGISTALYEMAEANNTGLLIYPEKLMFYSPAVKFCEIFNLDPLGIISSGCVVGIIGKDKERELTDFCKKRKIKMQIIGETSEKDDGVWCRKGGIKDRFPRFERDEINRLQ
ncbi:MAG: HAD-IA family hydrolase [Elusimicrobia bacterium]|nr:HAD-IA family hydrolase [Elusimicrobiota bacterium]